jgi:type I restriction enzyme S subunit
MSFPRHEKYKDSGVEWLGELPEHWSIEKFRYCFRESPEKIENEVVGEMLSVSGYRGIEIKEYDDENRRRTDEDLIGYRIVRKGQLVVNTMWLNYAGLGVSSFEGHVSPAYRSYWIADNLNKRFIHYLLRSSLYVNGYTKYLTGIRPNSLQMSRDDLMAFPILIPSQHEQYTIAAFLDRETAKIDALIAEQQRLIELLKEKRQAIISHAVTKGLNPDAPMKDSGIEWLGEVPAHWEVKRLKNISPQVTVGIVVEPSKYYVDDGIPALRSLNIQPCSITLDHLVYISPESNELLSKSRLNAGDLVAVRSGQPGTTTVVPSELEGCNCIDLIIIRKPLGGSEYFLCWYLNSDSAVHQFSEGSGGAIQQHFNIGTAMNLVIPMPPNHEQDEIATILDRETVKLDALTAEANRAITLLQERRAALISAAVTGKIDVRGLANRKAA